MKLLGTALTAAAILALVFLIPPGNPYVILTFLVFTGLLLHLVFSFVKIGGTLGRALKLYLPLLVVYILYLFWQKVFGWEFLLYAAVMVGLAETGFLIK